MDIELYLPVKVDEFLLAKVADLDKKISCTVSERRGKTYLVLTSDKDKTFSFIHNALDMAREILGVEPELYAINDFIMKRWEDVKKGDEVWRASYFANCDGKKSLQFVGVYKVINVKERRVQAHDQIYDSFVLDAHFVWVCKEKFLLKD